MATTPWTEEQVAEDLVILNVANVGLSDEQFIELCSDNRELVFELTAQKELVIMTPPGPGTGRRNSTICTDLENWSRANGRGITFSPNTVFTFTNGAKRGPDASWLKREAWDRLTPEEKDKVPLLCPSFVMELMSPSDRRPYRFRMVQAKMVEYIENGVELGWLIDPYQKKVHIYRSGHTVEILENPTTISGDPVLPGFVFSIAQIWQP
jgi:Uma2 family endonuclease